MALRLSIVQIGKGTIGGTLVEQVAAQRPAIEGSLGVELIYAGIAGRAEAAFDAQGLDLARWRREMHPEKEAPARRLVREAARSVPGAKVLLDATADEGMAGLYCEAFDAGFHVVTCNKKPLAGPLADYRRTLQAARAAGRFFLYEVTVGAGLPILGTLRDLLDSGDRVGSIEGCFSGTLNFLCAGLDRGGRFSEVLRQARDRGFTEPDPREDLAGRDVARKALILAREAGLAIEPDRVRLEPFCQVTRTGDAAAFLASAATFDAPLSRMWEEAAARGLRRRYVATVQEGCSAGPREVPADGPLGRLGGPENVFAFRTERYAEHPLVVAGPGAGPAVTAAGAFGDLLSVARALARGGRGSEW